MDSTNLILSMLFGTVGMGLLMYGKSQQRVLPLGAGLALMVFPYFITSAAIMAIVGMAITATPFLFRDA